MEVANLNLERTEVRAVADGYVTNLELHAGDYVQAGTPALALVDINSFHVVGYFEETKLPRIRVGARVSVALMGSGESFRGPCPQHRQRHRGPRAQPEPRPAGEHQPDLHLGPAGAANPGPDIAGSSAGGLAAKGRPDRHHYGSAGLRGTAHLW